SPEDGAEILEALRRAQDYLERTAASSDAAAHLDPVQAVEEEVARPGHSLLDALVLICAQSDVAAAPEEAEAEARADAQGRTARPSPCGPPDAARPCCTPRSPLWPPLPEATPTWSSGRPCTRRPPGGCAVTPVWWCTCTRTLPREQQRRGWCRCPVHGLAAPSTSAAAAGVPTLPCSGRCGTATRAACSRGAGAAASCTAPACGTGPTVARPPGHTRRR